MRRFTLFGFVIIVLSVTVAARVEHIDLSQLWHRGAFFLVVLGSLGAATIQTSGDAAMAAISEFFQLFRPSNLNREQAIKRWTHLNKRVRRDGAYSVDEYFKKYPDPWLQRSVSRLLAGTATIEVVSSLEIRLDNELSTRRSGAMFFDAWGGYAPTLGIVGAVLGLIEVMRGIDDPVALGGGIATAFIATLYGLMLSNTVLLPVSQKMFHQIDLYERRRRLDIVALASFAAGDSNQVMASKLKAVA